MSAGFIVGLPVVILYNRFLDHFIQGLTATGTS
jgi:ABC-type glycerol-3-phosphate transport system permease component